jgi:hypothetical protein
MLSTKLTSQTNYPLVSKKKNKLPTIYEFEHILTDMRLCAVACMAALAYPDLCRDHLQAYTVLKTGSILY